MKLAIHGGEPAIPIGMFQASPPTSSIDERYVLESLRGPNHAWGEQCERLQREWAVWNGNRGCIAVTSGTAALQMALAACGVCAGDEVITPAYSWTSSATCILHHHAIPVFVDVDPVHANLDPAKVEEAIGPRTRAILAVHLHGVPVDLDPVLEIGRRRGVRVIEDACQAHGALYKGRKVGTLTECAAFSLNQNKMFSAGEGGLFVADDPEMLEKARSLVLFGDFRDPAEIDGFPGFGLGYMYRYNELCAAYARAQLTQLDANIAHARSLFALLRDGLAGIPGLEMPVEPEYATENGYNFVCRVDPAAAGYDGPEVVFREAIVAALAAEGVPCMVWQRRILPEMAAIAARNAFGHGSPWREHGSGVTYDPARYPNALRHVDRYFILGGMRLPNGPDSADMVVRAARKVYENLDSLDVEAVAAKANREYYERGWRSGRRAGA